MAFVNTGGVLSGGGVSTFAFGAAADVAQLQKHTSGHINVLEAPYNAKGDGVTDDTAAFTAAIAATTGTVIVPRGTYKITSRLTIATGKALIGEGAASSILKAAINGDVVLATSGNNTTIRGLGIEPFSGFAYLFDGIGIDGNYGTVDQVHIVSPDKGVRLLAGGGESDWNRYRLAISDFKTAGIDLSTIDAGATFSNNNTIEIMGEFFGKTSDYPSFPTDTYGIRLHGTVNTVIGGEIAYAKYAVDDQGAQNKWIGVYMEFCRTLKVGPGAHYFDSHVVLDQPPQIDATATVFGRSGLGFGQYSHFTTAAASAADLKALWYFDEIRNGKVLDHSGNGRHVAAGASPQWVYSPYSKVLWQSPTDSSGTLDLGVSAVDWTQPFSLLMLVRTDTAASHTIMLDWEAAGGKFTRITVGPGNPHFQDYDGVTIREVSWAGAKVSSYPGANGQAEWLWMGFYINPTTKSIKLLDFWTQNTAAQTNASFNGALWNTPTNLYVANSSGIGAGKGALAFLAFWQREVTLPEVLSIINQRTLWTPPKGRLALSRLISEVSADRGDTSQTLTVGTDAPTQRWATALTANRTVTLSTTGAMNGDTFTVVRTGLGAFTLDVGGLKTIPSATAARVDVAYNGSAWVLTGYGPL